MLSKFNNQCVYVAENDIRSFKIKPVDPENYSWSIPVLSLLSISHGFLLIITLPINLTSTIIMTSKGFYQYEYTNRELNFSTLKMYSRFPDGIPKNIKIEDIKSGLF